ncbi:male-enhanced antigen 1-like [Cebus imitator]|uniref:male-enhanced antigen 1-like n=1 Tax=Cebus imitator TaxID=2715852 RepID=UPI00189BF40B|nr:male-enhanced antigen 1-like [Cebus imitator]
MGPEGHLSGAPAWMATVVLGWDSMGPECIFPNPTEELGPHQGPSEDTGDWSSEEPEEEQEEMGSGPASYSYQPLNQDPEQEEVELAPIGDGDVVADIQD